MKLKIKWNWKWVFGLFVSAIGWAFLHGVTGIEHWSAQDFKMLGSVAVIVTGLIIMEYS